MRLPFEVCSDSRKACLSWLVPCFSLISRLGCGLACYSDGAINFLSIAYTQIPIVLGRILRLKHSHTLFQTQSPGESLGSFCSYSSPFPRSVLIEKSLSCCFSQSDSPTSLSGQRWQPLAFLACSPWNRTSILQANWGTVNQSSPTFGLQSFYPMNKGGRRRT